MSDDRNLSPVEQAILEAMRDGLFDNLPGMGKPLGANFQEESNIPEEMRLAYKIMKDHEVMPEWMMMGKALTQQHEKILHEIERGIRAYQGALHDADRVGDLGRRSRANKAWERLILTFKEAATQYNRMVLTYNLKVPPSVARRTNLDIDREIEKLMPRL